MISIFIYYSISVNSIIWHSFSTVVSIIVSVYVFISPQISIFEEIPNVEVLTLRFVLKFLAIIYNKSHISVSASVSVLSVPITSPLWSTSRPVSISASSI